MALQEQIRPDSSIERQRNFRLNGPLGFAVCHAVVLAFLPMPHPHDNVRAVGGNSSYRRNAPKEQYAVGAWICDIGKLLEFLARLGNGTDKTRPEVTPKLILHSCGDFLQPHRSQFRHHAARFQRTSEIRWRRCQKLPRLDSDLPVQSLPTFGTRDIASRIPAVPPHEKKIWISWPARLLVAIKGLQLFEELGNR